MSRKNTKRIAKPGSSADSGTWHEGGGKQHDKENRVIDVVDVKDVEK
jgi:hypothetical protein